MNDRAKLTFLGTGTSQGIPIIGCDCDVCRSSDSKDKRLRASALVEWKGLSILIDAGPDFRYQMLRAGIRHLDAILLTHAHKDHTGGLDDVRSFNLIERKAVNIYCMDYVLESLKKEYSYAFTEPKYPGVPEWNIHTLSGLEPFEVYSNKAEDDLEWVSGRGYVHHHPFCDSPVPSVTVVPIRGYHDKSGKLPVLGYRFGNIAYLTDMNYIPEEEMKKLEGVECLTINCVKFGPHHSHFSLDEAIDFCRKSGAREAYITHLSHMLPKHSELQPMLPPGILLSYDGLVIG